MKFTRRLSSKALELLNLRVHTRHAGCRHCCHGSSVIAHGYLRGIAAAGTGTASRALRFFAPTAIPTPAAAAPSPSIGMT
jgi:hypothetical protein